MKQRDQAYDAFVQHLLGGHLAPGSFVTQRELVALTGLPLGAVREMIPRLEADGLIATLPQRGLQVAAVDLRLVREAVPAPGDHRDRGGGAFRPHRAGRPGGRAPGRARPRQRGGAGGITPALIAEAQAIDWGLPRRGRRPSRQRSRQRDPPGQPHPHPGDHAEPRRALSPRRCRPPSSSTRRSWRRWRRAIPDAAAAALRRTSTPRAAGPSASIPRTPRPPLPPPPENPARDAPSRRTS